MSKWRTIHSHLTRMIGYGQPVEQFPEVLTDSGDAPTRLLEEIAARFVEHGCRVKKYRNGIRIYDCNEGTTDQSFENTACAREDCNIAHFEAEYGRWTKADRAKYLVLLHEKGIIP